ncbi:hypothetical protein [Nodularia chucula]
MPFIKIQTSVSKPAKADVEMMLKSLSSKLAKHLVDILPTLEG